MMLPIVTAIMFRTDPAQSVDAPNPSKTMAKTGGDGDPPLHLNNLGWP